MAASRRRDRLRENPENLAGAAVFILVRKSGSGGFRDQNLNLRSFYTILVEGVNSISHFFWGRGRMFSGPGSRSKPTESAGLFCPFHFPGVRTVLRPKIPAKFKPP
jgi:hypothetical protein